MRFGDWSWSPAGSSTTPMRRSSRALLDFAEGGLKGEGPISEIVSLVNDTRASLEDRGEE